ncbi:DNA polymerase III subunit delta' [Bacillus thuringiensis]|uniref:DNA polymerase III subunit delta n=1 Tax=Bacillus wiedmannii TaxID=1890302 RepID=A0A242YZ17_9BACI|nr:MULTISPECIES: DNA polymerase III subunit delta' [Bacillus cereus group]MBG9749672.1 DNA polymerase III subunit delta' [Bacillus thuringiensis]MBG9778199.1 DNA polymerase III subunit delta' [Bacillus thuringiensis]OTX84947.1 DNA polymerase III subunit delta' [Bacillus wiedmannii]OTZ82514.1 DNA polymerase III subunit delta' [Bacillus thuringiensis serovar ostriniae]
MTWNELQDVQPKVARILQNSIRKEKVAHAYIYEGNKGIGKYQVALLYAKTLLCNNGSNSEPCHACKNCTRIDTGNHPDIIYIKPDGASIKKEQIEELQKEFSYASFESGKKIYIIENAEKMTANAANSLLKFLEEPESDCIAILLTERSNALLSTIISRCQLIRFAPISPKKVQEALTEQLIFGEEAKILSKLTNDLEQARKISEELTLGPKLDLIQEFIQKCNTLKVYALKKELAEAFAGKEGTLIFYHIVMLWFEDFLNYHLNRKNDLVFNEEILDTEVKKYKLNQILHLIKCAQKYQGRVHNNLTFTTLFDGFVAESQGVVAV